jgi:hypothetical protein
MNTHRIRRLVAIPALAAALTGLAAIPADAAPEEVTAPAHTSTEINNICRVIEQSTWPNWDTNEVGVAYTAAFHFYGLHYARCCFFSLRYGFKVYALYLIGWGDLTFPQNDPWCR